MLRLVLGKLTTGARNRKAMMNAVSAAATTIRLALMLPRSLIATDRI